MGEISGACGVQVQEARRRRPLALFAVGLASTLLLALCFAGRAAAEVNPTFFQELPTTQQEAAVNFFYEQSPQSTVPYEGGAAELSESMSRTYESQSESQPFYEELVGDVNEVGQDGKTFPEIEDAVPEILPAAGAFAVGWKIGEGIDAVFADIGLGFGSAPESEYIPQYSFCYSEKCGGELIYEPHGTSLWEGEGVQQWPGAYLYSGELLYYGEWGPGYFPFVRWFNAPCEFNNLNLPPEAMLQSFVPTGKECWDAADEKIVSMYEVYPYVPLKKALSREEFHHYNPLVDPEPDITTPAPENPGTAVVEEAVEKNLDESEFDQDYMTQAQEPEPEYEFFPAPTATEKKVKEEERLCDRGTAEFTNLGGNKSPEPFALRESAPFTVASLPEGVESPAPVYLRWGESKWQGKQREEPQYMDLWGGWGYRHIQAKHGWNELDRLETEEALETPQKPISDGGLRWRYSAPDEDTGQGGVNCERVVIVQFARGENKKNKEEDPAPRGIVSSFNEVASE